ncbi:ROK family glucokinase [soil metagenome]|jgi:glucokinase
MGLTIGVDVGGTKAAGGVVDEAGTVLAAVRRPTPSQDPQATEDVIATVVEELRENYDVEAVGLGAAGFVDESRSTVLFAPNLAWREEPLRADVERRVGLPVVVENDANAAAWAEYRFGAGRGHRHVVLVTLGTGIGGGIVVDGALYRGRFGIGGEFGHVNAVRDGRRCGCGNRGCWEQYASGRALVREAQELARESPLVAGRMLELAGGSADAIDGPVVTRAAAEGDPSALECFRLVGDWLGRGLADLAAVLDPSCFVLGGGVSEAGDLLLQPAARAFTASLTGRGHRPVAEVKLAELGAAAGLVGAADLARVRS